MNKAEYFWNAALFVARKHIVGFEVNPTPSFEPEALQFFRSIIRKSNVYVEYGSGGSTIEAAKHVETLVSVESDPVFRRAVERQIPADSKAEIHFLNPYVGVTAHWGTPVFGRPTPSRVKRWMNYPRAPWQVLKETPDTILVDGRMRVACTLESLLHIGWDTVIMVDDYERHEYRVIEGFADLINMHDNMAEFRKKSDFDSDFCQVALTEAYSKLR